MLPSHEVGQKCVALQLISNKMGFLKLRRVDSKQSKKSRDRKWEIRRRLILKNNYINLMVSIHRYHSEIRLGLVLGGETIAPDSIG